MARPISLRGGCGTGDKVTRATARCPDAGRTAQKCVHTCACTHIYAQPHSNACTPACTCTCAYAHTYACACMCALIHVQHARVHVSTHTHRHTCICACTHAHPHMHVCAHTCNTHTCVHMHARTHTAQHTHGSMHTQTHVHAHMHACTSAHACTMHVYTRTHAHARTPPHTLVRGPAAPQAAPAPTARTCFSGAPVRRRTPILEQTDRTRLNPASLHSPKTILWKRKATGPSVRLAFHGQQAELGHALRSVHSAIPH